MDDAKYAILYAAPAILGAIVYTYAIWSSDDANTIIKSNITILDEFLKKNKCKRVPNNVSVFDYKKLDAQINRSVALSAITVEQATKLREQLEALKSKYGDDPQDIEFKIQNDINELENLLKDSKFSDNSSTYKTIQNNIYTSNLTDDQIDNLVRQLKRIKHSCSQ